jgi:hypothetical protein
MTFTHSALPLLGALALTLTAPLTAQELLGVGFSGQAFGIDLETGQGRTIGPTGLTNVQAMARHDFDLYLAGRVGLQPTLARLDSVTAVATPLFSLTIDLRGLAGREGTNELFGIANGATDQLVRIDLATGVVTTVGNTGFANIQALTEENGVVYAWETSAGLLTIDPATGVASDPFPAIGTQGQDLQFLAIDHTGQLVGGRNTLFAVNIFNGSLQSIGGAGFTEVRGAELHFGTATPFGSGCLSATGIVTTLRSKGLHLAGVTDQFLSVQHPPQTLGVLCVGLSTSVHLGTPLPLQLDPLLGTVNCNLLVSPDLTLAVLGNGAGVVATSFAMVPVLGAELHFQLATLEAVPGGLAFTDGLTIQLPF